MSWLNDPDDAAKHPKRGLAFMFVSGLVGGGLLGYFRFGRSVPWAVAVGVTFAAIGTSIGWKSIKDAATTEPGSRRKRALDSKMLIRFSLPWLALALAFVVGLAAHSEHVFVAVFAAALILAFVLRFTLLR